MPATTVVLADRYRLVDVIGRGGMGVVWEAFDELLRRSVAVKEVDFPAGITPEERDRLAAATLREARAVAAVETSAAVRVFDVVEQSGKPWLVMELVRGRTLTDVLRERGPLPQQEVARVGLALLTALDVAHAAGVLHRDVKPGNVLIGTDGRVALTDFGIATVATDPAETTTGLVVGSPAYIAPERAKGERPTPASDLWSLGATLWTAVEGRPPYDGPTAFVVVGQIAYDDPPIAAHAGAVLRELLRRMMDRDPASRPPSAEIRQRLGRVLHSAEPQPEWERPAPLERSFDRTTTVHTGLPPAEPVVADRVPTPSPPSPLPAVAPPGPPLQRQSSPPARGRRRAVALVGGAVVVVGLVVAGILLALTDGHGGHPTATGVGSSSGAKSHGSPSPSASHSPAVPAGFTRYRDPSLGWSIAVPAGWQRSQTAGGTQFTDPAGGRYVLVATRYPAGSSAVGAWRDQEQAFEGDHTGYQRLELRTISVAGAADAADWEFRYTDGGAQLEALDRGMVFGSRGYGVFFQTHTDQWDASASLRAAVLASFQPGRTGP
jgi:serine/threonine protein kinase